MIQLQFVLSPGPGSAAISWFSAGHLSHVDAVLPDGTLLGARFSGGVQVRSSDYEKFTRVVRAELDVSPVEECWFYDFLRAQVGKPYDWRAIAAFAMNRDWREDDSWICSEMQGRALEVPGIVDKFYLACNKITPVALALAVSALPFCRMRVLL